MKGALVVGGAGYIGSHMVLALKKARIPVFVFDNLSRGHRDAVSEADLYIGDIRNLNDIEDCFKAVAGKIDTVFHFAALAYVGESVQRPDLYYENNVSGSINLLNAMLKNDIKKFIFSSTCATYGQPDSLPIKENTPQNPINPYGRSKLMVEQILRDYAKSYDFKSIILRYFNAAGCDPGGLLGERHDPETHLIPLLLLKAYQKLHGVHSANDFDFKIYGNDYDTVDGTCVRDFVHVNDLCDAHLKAAIRLSNLSSEGVSEFYNLCNGNGFSVLDVISAVEKVTGVKIDYLVEGRRPGDPANLVGNSDLAYRKLKWKSNIFEIDSIIESAWNSFKYDNN